MAPHAEPALPRRARLLVPAGLPRRGQLIAVCAVLLVLVHLLFAQLTLVLVVVFAVIGATTRWRRWWLLWPALAGGAWALAIGPDQALAGFAAGPASVLRHLAAGRAAGDAGHPLSVFSGAGGWLPRQFPVALPLAAAEAAALGWLAWLRTDEWAVPAPRPGVVAALRAAVTTWVIRDGAVVTRDGCALGTVPETGAAAELRWAEIASGVLVTGADEQQVALASLQLVHAALRRRKPVIVLDDGHDGAVAAALAAACRATGTPLRHDDGGDQAAAARPPGGAGGPGASASQLWGRADRGRPGARGSGRGAGGNTAGGNTAGGNSAGGNSAGGGGENGGGLGDGSLAGGSLAGGGLTGLTGVIGERSAVLLPVGSPELADRALASLTALAAGLRGVGVDGDALVWAPHAERLPPRALGALLRDGATAGLAVLTGTTSPAAAAALAGHAGTALIGRLTDPELAAVLAARTGTRLLPPSAAAALAGRQPGDHRSPELGTYGPPEPGTYRSPEAGTYRSPEAGTYRPPEAGTYRSPEAGDYRPPEAGDYRPPEAGDYRPPEDGEYRRPEPGQHRKTGGWGTGAWETGGREAGGWKAGGWETGDWETGREPTRPTGGPALGRASASRPVSKSASRSASGPSPWSAAGLASWSAGGPTSGPTSGPVAASAAGPGSAPELVPCPVVPARVLLALRRDEFVLAVSVPRPRHVAPGRLVPARLPRPAPVPAPVPGPVPPAAASPTGPEAQG